MFVLIFYLTIKYILFFKQLIHVIQLFYQSEYKQTENYQKTTSQIYRFFLTFNIFWKKT